MSDHEPTQAYVYQPYVNISRKTHAAAERLWGVGGIDRTTFLAECTGLTRPEADAVCAAIRATQGTDPEAVESPDPTVHAPSPSPSPGHAGLLAEVREALIWCSGSADFAPGGIAYKGWQKVKPLIARLAEAERTASPAAGAVEELFVIFDGPPSHESGRFIEVENAQGASVGGIDWKQRGDGLWSLGPFRRVG